LLSAPGDVAAGREVLQGLRGDPRLGDRVAAIDVHRVDRVHDVIGLQIHAADLGELAVVHAEVGPAGDVGDVGVEGPPQRRRVVIEGVLRARPRPRVAAVDAGGLGEPLERVAAPLPSLAVAPKKEAPRGVALKLFPIYKH
jgi:hypothetical protein